MLVIDDNVEIHRYLREILAGGEEDAEFDAMDLALFGAGTAPVAMRFEVTSVYRGEDGIVAAREAREEGAPFSLAFVDVRMPAGMDGVETLERIWAEDPEMQAVICTAHAEVSWNRILSRLGAPQRFLVLKKPFDAVEVRQMACALTEKWWQEATLRRGEARTRAMLIAVPDTMLRISADGRCEDLRAVVGAQDRSLEEALPEGAVELARQAVATVLAGGPTQVFEVERYAEGRLFEARVARAGEADALLLLRDVTDRRMAELAAAQQQIHEETIAAQAEMMMALSTPLLPIHEDVVVMPLVGTLDPRRVDKIREVLTQGVAERGVSIAILDLTGVLSLDAEMAHAIVSTARAVRLLGAESVLTGLGSSVARTLVEQGADLGGIRVHRDLGAGVAYALRARGPGRARG
ncbi:RsbR, positive regulator of sigma-B [Chondromyces apiculatus DSM 436]|uniref:RsbR, positive regulator of sigma-B n=1 Tax=Chondromyces apiculatus DSM 436 TaxID=1192034 RepID=A0A017T834_9BACT|nr:RsbR, positive regulator of sigma-B [Chondromyces apiculatus DSM 436]